MVVVLGVGSMAWGPVLGMKDDEEGMTSQTGRDRWTQRDGGD